MKVLLKPGILNDLKKQANMSEQEFAIYIGVSRSQLWRVKLPPSDKRFSLGQDFIAKILKKFPKLSFEDIFFLEKMSHECDSKRSATA